MIYKFLITMILLSDLIICLFIIKIDKKINEYNAFITESRPLIKDMLKTIREMSEKILELAPAVVDKIKNTITDFALGQLKNLLGSITFILVKREIEKRL